MSTRHLIWSLIKATSALVKQLDDDDVSERSGSPPGDYGQVIPPRDSKHGVRRTAPPMLPPHLLQMVLNKEVAAHVSVTGADLYIVQSHMLPTKAREGLTIIFYA